MRRAVDSRAIWALVRQQHGVVSREQLLALGVSRRGIERRLERGRLHRAGAGVYAVGRPELKSQGRWMAAVLACGSGAFLTHSSAAALWGIAPEWGGGIEVATRSASPRKRPGVRVRRRPSLRRAAITERRRIPVTTPVQTLVDLAARLGPRHTERAINEADRLGLVTPVVLRSRLEDHRGEPGVARLRALLDRRTFRLTRSDLEQIFLPIAAEVGLPVPLTKQLVNGFEVDFHWPELGLVVESDGLRYHRTPAEQARDRLRDQAHVAAGLTQLRFTDEQVRYDPGHVRRTLASTVHRLSVTAGEFDGPLSGS